MQRHILGVLSILFLIATGIILFFGIGEESQTRFFGGVCMRVGLTLGAIWLAMPQLEKLFHRFPTWIWVWSLVGLVAATVRWNVAIVVFGIVAIIALLRGVTWLFTPYQPPERPADSKQKPPSSK